MEGCRRGLAVAVGIGVVIATGCGGESSQPRAGMSGVVQTADPARAFAPLIEMPRRERYRPMTARWFIERSVLRFADRESCTDRKVAVGHGLPEQRELPADWIYPRALGHAPPTYYRNPLDSACELDFELTVLADDLTRPRDSSPLRVEGLGAAEGFYLDLANAARVGPEQAVVDDAQAGASGSVSGIPVYFELRDEGDSGVRLTYWMLYGTHVSYGRPAAAREGDWERVDVLLHEAGEGRYAPQSLQLWPDPVRDGARPAAAGPGAPLPDGRRDVPWSSVARNRGTHPVLAAAPGSHSLASAPRNARCRGCARWRTWDRLSAARRQRWYGFGGAWGEPGATSATTGPLGPRGW